jgi:hypothetical protein
MSLSGTIGSFGAVEAKMRLFGYMDERETARRLADAPARSIGAGPKS